eukprot:11049551-Alexandrium_andersonii.AAC.1
MGRRRRLQFEFGECHAPVPRHEHARGAWRSAVQFLSASSSHSEAYSRARLEGVSARAVREVAPVPHGLRAFVAQLWSARVYALQCEVAHSASMHLGT